MLSWEHILTGHFNSTQELRKITSFHCSKLSLMSLPVDGILQVSYHKMSVWDHRKPHVLWLLAVKYMESTKIDITFNLDIGQSVGTKIDYIHSSKWSNRYRMMGFWSLDSLKCQHTHSTSGSSNFIDRLSAAAAISEGSYCTKSYSGNVSSIRYLASVCLWASA